MPAIPHTAANDNAAERLPWATAWRLIAGLSIGIWLALATIAAALLS